MPPIPNSWVKPLEIFGEVGKDGAFQRAHYKDMPADQKTWLTKELLSIGNSRVEFREFCNRNGDRLTEVTIDRTENGEPS